ncbi:EthD domain-containing protein [Aquisediminimonas profunda]|uniref:EthD domain-containing protein n=1 Tax=Aquisediminimonas profunda TaxID=1550733 RepID=UPI001C62FC6C|nr:EthD domain-containing protein [Aquisediminimonas profunda]
MLKMICHFKRRPGLTLEEMKDRYENGHVPLILKMCPPVMDYRRNYRIEDGKFDPFEDGSTAEPDYDVITEVWFRNREEFEAMAEFVSRPDIAPVIIADEEQFMDRSASRMLLFEEFSTDQSAFQQRTDEG